MTEKMKSMLERYDRGPVWHDLTNLHCYSGEYRPNDEDDIVVKIVSENEEGKVSSKIAIGYYEATDDKFIDQYCEFVVSFNDVESWIYLNELKELM